jgi:chorismate-pyruvate lyase
MASSDDAIDQTSKASLVDLTSLLALLGDDRDSLGSFQRIASDSMPLSFQRLLAHQNHMTVAVEEYHRCPVTVEVVQSKRFGETYFREILLRRSDNQSIVQYGIVRLQLAALAPAAREEILAEKTPLGRVLIEHNVLREVELVDLWKIEQGPRLRRFFESAAGDITFGRTAMIHFGHQPALELLEIIRLANESR